MKVIDLIDMLQSLSDDHKQLPVAVQDGMDPSDFTEADYVEVRDGYSVQFVKEGKAVTIT